MFNTTRKRVLTSFSGTSHFLKSKHKTNGIVLNSFILSAKKAWTRIEAAKKYIVFKFNSAEHREQLNTYQSEHLHDVMNKQTEFQFELVLSNGINADIPLLSNSTESMQRHAP